MNRTLMQSGVLAAAIFVNVAHAQGTFPPTTPPGTPIFKTLDQLEGRTPLNSPTSAAPYTISASGSYYLTSDIVVTSGNAITISANGVTLDLNGFSVISSSDPASGTGIEITGTSRSIVICNGRIQGGTTYSGSVFSALKGFTSGVSAAGSGYNYSVHHLMVSGIAGSGIAIATSSGRTSASVWDCIVTEVGGNGITAGRVKNCTVSKVGQDGINALVVTNCQSQSVSTNPVYYGIDASTVADCVASGNAGRGISVTGTIDRCFGRSTSGYALYANGSIANSTGDSTSGAAAIFSGGVVSYCRANRPGGTAISAVAVIGSYAATGQVITGSAVKQFSSP